jgi:hypothetical protein
MIVASSLLYSNIVLRYLSTLTADALASSLAIMTVGFLVMAVAKGRRPDWRWACFTAALFATYQTRPAYLFLPLLAPILGLGLKALLDARGRNGEEDAWRRTSLQPDAAKAPWDRVERTGWRRAGTALCVASLAPLLAFCTVRWAVVGQFSLVSFGGHNFAGLVGQFLDEDLATELPPETRPLAAAALARQRALTPNEPLRLPGPGLRYSAVENRWDRTTWNVFAPAAKELYPGDQQEVNSRLRDLAIAIVRARPGLYALWLAKAFLQGARLIVAEILLNPAYFLFIASLLAAHTSYVVQRLRRPLDRAELDAESFTALNSLLLASVSFAAAKLTLVVVTTPPQGRFMDAAGVLLPTVIAAALADRLQRLRACEARKQEREIAGE